MNYIGKLPENICPLAALNSIGENIIIADKEYNVTWMNSSSIKLFAEVVPLFGFTSVEELIGMNMDQFHQNPKHQRQVMEQVTHQHRARIKILDLFLADIVITTIKDEMNEIQGYLVMLMDVTTKAEEEKRKDRLINSLSVPILQIWEKTIAVTLVGEFDTDRANRLITKVVNECASEQHEYALIDLSGISNYDEVVGKYIQMLNDTLRLIGTKCIIVGINPNLAITIVSLEADIPTFSSAYAGLQFIIKHQG